VLLGHVATHLLSARSKELPSEQAKANEPAPSSILLSEEQRSAREI